MGPSRNISPEGEFKKDSQMTTLSDFAIRYVATRKICRMYALNVQRRARAIEAFVGKSAIAEVLTEKNVTDFLISLDRSVYTLRSYRSDYLALWNCAADQDLVPYPLVRRIFCPPLPSLLVECFEIGEVRAILECLPRMRGVYPNGVRKRDYWNAAIRLAWDSGARRGDVLSFRRDAIRMDGVARIIQHKTQKPIAFRLRQSTVFALDSIGSKTPCAWSLDLSFFSRHFHKLVIAAGVNRGSFRWLRRSSGSYVEWKQAGAGRKHLGHSSEAVFDRFYDAKLGGPSLPMPPEL